MCRACPLDFDRFRRQYSLRFDLEPSLRGRFHSRGQALQDCASLRYLPAENSSQAHPESFGIPFDPSRKNYSFQDHTFG